MKGMSYCVLIPDSQLLDIVWFGFASRIRLSQAGLRTEKGEQQTFIVFKSKFKEGLQEEAPPPPPPPATNLEEPKLPVMG